MGEEQKRWLRDGLHDSAASWNVIANQGRFAPFDRESGTGKAYRITDTWGDGYVTDRRQLLEFFQQTQVSNPVVITGDAHKNWVFDLKEDFDDPDSETLSTEFLGTSVSTAGDRRTIETRYGGTADNPYEVFADGRRGYVHCELTSEEWRCDYRVTDSVRSRDASVYTLASFVVEDSRPGAQRA